jgi:hypothetical protein
MPHPIPISRATKEGLSTAINGELRKVKISRQGTEPNYTAATIQVLDGFEYKGNDCIVTIQGVVVNPYTTEHWSGADFTIHTTITQAGLSDVQKATLVQSKLGKVEHLSTTEIAKLLKEMVGKTNKELNSTERLLKQIQDMRALTPHPKVLEVPRNDEGMPRIVSAVGIIESRRLQHQTFGDWLATRVLPTFDGDTRREFTGAVLETSLKGLRIYARKR